MLNKVILQGRLTHDPEQRQTQSGTVNTTFSLAVERDFKDKTTGTRGVDFINCVSWGSTAEHIARYMSKGRMAVVEGRLQVRNYTDKEGNKRYATEVVVDRLYFTADRQGNAGGNGGGQGAPSYGGSQPVPEGFTDLGYGGEDQLPF